ncbi:MULTISPECIES: hypothetical protein [Ralstonia]|jgi:hypothetical protein|uniref:Uncharacterized protein n=2 Tax=Ralstonia pickettii TaxID=329 RepID=R0E9A1_RALPI|nr:MULTISPECIES: hypothetical protein [Ralstonia]ENZ77997.1 hypothetical protein OR214_02273 [Ralstonia pickettii OR214]MCM3581913.1 hypothetical protein [Ralstonia pickettii]
MSNVIQLRVDGEPTQAERAELEHCLATRFGVNLEQLHAAIWPLFLLMHAHGIGTVSIDQEGTKALVTVDGKAL